MAPMDIFYIVISCVFVVLLLTAIVLWMIESRIEYKRKLAISSRIESGKGLRVESDDLILKIKDGKVEICDEMPVKEAPAETEEAPVVVPMADETAADSAVSEEHAEKLEELQELVDKYGELTDNSIVFEASGKQTNATFIDKYAALDVQVRDRYDTLVAYILSNPDCKKTEASNAVTFKCRTDKIMKAMIKRGMVVLNFLLVNTDLHRFVREEGIKSIKINPVVIKLESDSDLLLAKQTADITIENIREEQQYRKERNKELRRQRYRQKESEE